MPGFGRNLVHDLRDNDFPLARLAAAAPPPAKPYKYWFFRYPPLNQGNEGTCVGHALKHFLMCSPIVTAPHRDPSAVSIYDRAIMIDEWVGNDNGDRNFGTSVRAGAKVLTALGHVQQYLWAFSLEEVINHVLTLGPVVMGTNWYTGMMNPDSNGFIHPTGIVEGGHAYLIAGVNKTKNVAQIVNSWGNWGKKGRTNISLDDLARLISEEGEACVALEQRVIL